MQIFIQQRKKAAVGVAVVTVGLAMFWYIGVKKSAEQGLSTVVANQVDELPAARDVFFPENQGVLRDPFRLPTAVQAVAKAEPERKSQPAAAPHKQAEHAPTPSGNAEFRLAGIVSSEGERVAILVWNKQRGVYKIHDQANGYEIMAIDDQGVLLRRGHQETFLRVGGL